MAKNPQDEFDAEPDLNAEFDAEPQNEATWQQGDTDYLTRSKPQEHPSAWDAFKYSVGNAWGEAPRTEAALRAVTGEDYNKALGEEKKRAARVAKEQPVASALGETTSNLALGAGVFSGAGEAVQTARGVKALADGTRAATALERAKALGELGLRGGLLSGAQGAATSKGDPGSTAKASTIGALAGPLSVLFPGVASAVGTGVGLYGALDGDLPEKDRIVSGIGGGASALATILSAANAIRNYGADKVKPKLSDALEAAKAGSRDKISAAERALAKNGTAQQDAKIQNIRDLEKRALAELKAKDDAANASYQKRLKEDPEYQSSSEPERNNAFRKRAVERGKEIRAEQASSAKRQKELDALNKQLEALAEEEAGVPGRVSQYRRGEFQHVGNRAATRDQYAKMYPEEAASFPLSPEAQDAAKKVGVSYLRNSERQIVDPDVSAAEYQQQLLGDIGKRRGDLQAALEALKAAPPEAQQSVAARVNPGRLVPAEELAALAEELGLQMPASKEADVFASRLPLTQKARSARMSRARTLAEELGLDTSPSDDFEPTEFMPESVRLPRRGKQPAPAPKSDLEKLELGLGLEKETGDVAIGNNDGTNPVTEKRAKEAAQRRANFKRLIDGNSDTEESLVGKTLTPEPPSSRQQALSRERTSLQSKLDELKALTSDESILDRGDLAYRLDQNVKDAKVPTSFTEAAKGLMSRGVDKLRGVSRPTTSGMRNPEIQAAYFKRLSDRFENDPALVKHGPLVSALLNASNPTAQALILGKLAEDPEAAKALEEER